MKRSVLLIVLLTVLAAALTGCNQKKIETLESQLATSEANLAEMTAQKEAGDAALKALGEERDTQLAEAEAKLKAVTEEKDAQLADADETLRVLSENADKQLAEAEANLKAVTEEKDTKIAEAEATLKAITEEKDAKIADAEANLKSVAEQKDAKIAEAEANLKSVTEEKDAKIAGLEADLKALAAEKDAQLAEAENELHAAAVEKNEKLAESQAALTALSAQMDEKIAEIEADLAAVTADKDAQIADARAALETLATEKDAKIAEIEANLSTVTAQKDEQLAEAESAVANLTKEKETLQSQSEADLHAAIKEKNEKLAEAESRIQEILKEKDQLSASYEEQIAALAAEKEALIAQYEGKFKPSASSNNKDTVPEKTEEDHDQLSMNKAIEAVGFDFFGTWYANETCIRNICFSIGDVGLQSDYTFNSDNSVDVFYIDADGKELEETGSWEIVDGILNVLENGENPMIVTALENGDLLLTDGEITLSLQRSVPDLALAGHVISDPALESFYGEWELTGWLLSGLYIPVEGWGIDGSISISSDGIDFILFDSPSFNNPYSFDEGKLIVESGSTFYSIEKQDNDTLRVVTDEDPENEFCLIFERANY